LGFTNNHLIVANDCNIKYVEVPDSAFEPYESQNSYSKVKKQINPFDLEANKYYSEVVKLKQGIRVLQIVEI
jgi:hypothetical protein